MNDERMNIWETKLAAWLHDPAEKALILLRADHEEDLPPGQIGKPW